MAQNMVYLVNILEKLQIIFKRQYYFVSITSTHTYKMQEGWDTAVLSLGGMGGNWCLG